MLSAESCSFRGLRMHREIPHNSHAQRAPACCQLRIYVVCANVFGPRPLLAFDRAVGEMIPVSGSEQ